MNGGIMARAARLIGRLYPERQIFLRSRGEVSFIVMGRKIQIGLTLASLTLLGWLAYASTGIFLQRDIIAGRDAHIARLADANDRLISDMRAVESQYRKITANLEQNQQLLGRALEQRASLDSARKNLLGELRQTKKQRELALLKNGKLQKRLTKLEASLRRTLDGSLDLQAKFGRLTAQLAASDRARELALRERRDLTLDLGVMGQRVRGLNKDRSNLRSDLSLVSQRLAKSLSDRDGARRERGDLAANLAAMRGKLSRLRKADMDLRGRLRRRENLVTGLTGQRDRARAVIQALDQRVANLEGRLERLLDTQRTLVGNINDRTDAGISELEVIVQNTGLNLDSLLQRAGFERAAVGGPLLGAERTGQGAEGLDLLETRLNRWNALNAVLERLPMMPPVDAFAMSSRFGKRRDPFTKRRAFHSGVDLAGIRRTPVYATSRGVVTYVGWKGPYGRLVEIDHGLGLRTRYGHLRKILVKRGQKVDFRQKIGLMGSSGRSTGSHVHYEVQFDGKAIDPMKFLKAGKYVFKG